MGIILKNEYGVINSLLKKLISYATIRIYLRSFLAVEQVANTRNRYMIIL